MQPQATPLRGMAIPRPTPIRSSKKRTPQTGQFGTTDIHWWSPSRALQEARWTCWQPALTSPGVPLSYKPWRPTGA
eukprot:7095909-Pyramimonas_sp.AAC.1